MPTAERVHEAIFAVFDDLNEDRAPDQQLPKSSQTLLFDKEGKLDSLAFVTFVISLEGEIQQRFGKTVTLANEQAMKRVESPFRSVQTLGDYIVELLDSD